jgi:transcriptional regulator with XRE-family HTH domain
VSGNGLGGENAEFRNVRRARKDSTMTKHPAKELGAWLKARRRSQGFVARVFAGQIELGPAEYAEAEAGVVRWIGQDQERLICQVLSLTPSDRQHFLKLLAQARAAKPLEFSDIYTRKQLEPVRLRCDGRKRLTKAARKEIVDAVFEPLA